VNNRIFLVERYLFSLSGGNRQLKKFHTRFTKLKKIFAINYVLFNLKHSHWVLTTKRFFFLHLREVKMKVGNEYLFSYAGITFSKVSFNPEFVFRKIVWLLLPITSLFHFLRLNISS